MKPEAQEKTETTGRDDNVCMTQLYRLICIHSPGKKTGRRILNRSATVAVQTGEQPAGSSTCRPEMPAETGYIMPEVPAGNNDSRPEQPAPETTGGGAV